MEGADKPKLVGDLFNIVTEVRVILHQMEIAPKPDSIDLRTQQSPSHAVPVFLRIQRGVAALCKGGQAAKPYGKQIRMQPQLMGGNIHPCTEPCLIAGENALDQPVKAEFMKSSVIRLYPYPAVIIKHVGFLSVFMHHIDKLLPKGNHKIIYEFHPVGLSLRAGHMGHVKPALIDEILSLHGITVLFLKLVQSQSADGIVIGTPVREKLAVSLTAAPDPDKVVEHGGEAHHRGVGMGLAPVLHPAQHIFLRLRISGIDLHQMLLVPVVGGMIVHGNLFPYAVGQKAHRIFVEGCDSLYNYRACFLIIAPFFSVYLLIDSSVINFPIFQGRLSIIDGKLLRKKTLHQADGKLLLFRHRCRGA